MLKTGLLEFGLLARNGIGGVDLTVVDKLQTHALFYPAPEIQSV